MKDNKLSKREELEIEEAHITQRISFLDALNDLRGTTSNKEMAELIIEGSSKKRADEIRQALSEILGDED